MRFNSKFIFVLGLSAAVSCAKTDTEANYAFAKRYVDAWMEVNHKGIEPTEDGIFILDDVPGDGASADAFKYLYVDYEVRTLDGTVSKASSAQLGMQLGTYDESSYYGPHFWLFEKGSMHAGVMDMVKGMKVGGTRTALIPRWLYSLESLDTEDDYIASSKGGSEELIYTLHVVDGTDDVLTWQADSIDRYVGKEYGKDQVTYDTLGFKYIRIKDPVNTKAFPSDTTIYINYTGRLLNGQVFDTTDEKIAKDEGLYKPGKSYAPVSVTWADEFKSIKLSGNSVISGFALTLWQMRKYEKGVGIFYSEYGYSSSGSGSAIPEYSPLLFEVEIVDKPKD